jgi:hypothetical protein
MWKKQKNIFHFFAEKKKNKKEEYRRYTRTWRCTCSGADLGCCVVYGERDQFLVEEKLRKISHFFSGHNSYILPIFFSTLGGVLYFSQFSLT